VRDGVFTSWGAAHGLLDFYWKGLLRASSNADSWSVTKSIQVPHVELVLPFVSWTGFSIWAKAIEQPKTAIAPAIQRTLICLPLIWINWQQAHEQREVDRTELVGYRITTISSISWERRPTRQASPHQINAFLFRDCLAKRTSGLMLDNALNYQILPQAPLRVPRGQANRLPSLQQ